MTGAPAGRGHRHFRGTGGHADVGSLFVSNGGDLRRAAAVARVGFVSHLPDALGLIGIAITTASGVFGTWLPRREARLPASPVLLTK